MLKYGFTFDPNVERARPCWSVTFKAVTTCGETLESGVIVDVDVESGASRLFDQAFAQNGLPARRIV